MIRKKSIDIQEQIDASIAQRIFKEIYGDKLTNWVIRTDCSPTDVLYTGSTKFNESHYSLELKSTKSTAWKQNGWIVKFSKYIKAREDISKRDNTEKLIWLFLSTETKEYYVYDMSSIDINNLNMTVMYLKKVQYADTDMVETPVFFLPTALSIKSGTYSLTDEEKALIELKKQYLSNKE